MKTPHKQYRSDQLRIVFMMSLFLLATLSLMGRSVDLHVLRKDFLQNQGDARYLRVVSMPANRGMITDRHGEPLAISTPVQSVWTNPKVLMQQVQGWPLLAKTLQLDAAQLAEHIKQNSQREFIYLKRHVTPDVVDAVTALNIPGVDFKKEYRRYYPSGEVSAHIVGFTDIDDVGQEGVELAYDVTLRATDGSKRVIKDNLGRIVENIELVSNPRPGDNLVLSIDKRIQYLTYRELKAAVEDHHAKAGSAVVLDAQTAEVLALVNLPSYNPNNRETLDANSLRNRAVTDLFEPGSTIKPFIAAAALESGLFTPQTIIDTAPGFYKVGNKLIRDTHHLGAIDVATVIKKSSNIGASKMAMTIAPQRLWEALSGAGFGRSSASDFPGEAVGVLNDYKNWRPIERATLSFGYGVSVTAMQLARAYLLFAGQQQPPPVNLLRQVYTQHTYVDQSQPLISQGNLLQVRSMLEGVVTEGGTATMAAIPGYRIAGKTGTVKKVGADGAYSEDAYLSIFAGLAPASDPRLVMVVIIDEPQGKQYYGGLVAAPVFSKVMSGALRVLDVAPDDAPSLKGGHLALLDSRQ